MGSQATVTEDELLSRAASGDRKAQAALVSHCVAKQFDGVSKFEAMTMAEGFALLAASHGHVEDALMLAGVKRIRAYHVAEIGDMDRAYALLSQSEALCEGLSKVPHCEGAEFLAGVLTAASDEGNELAAVRLNKLTAAMSPADADKLRTAVDSACRHHRETQEAARAC